MKFRNPVNGHVEEKQVPWLGFLVFGGLYLLGSGLWAPFLVWLVVAIGIFGAFGPSGILVLALLQLAFCVVIDGLVRSSYLAKGWTEVSVEGGPAFDESGARVAAEPPSELRTCPFCAEEIKAAAIKCKHCGSAVEPLAAAAAVYHTRDQAA